MKYQLLNGWTPHNLFSRLNRLSNPQRFFDCYVPGASPFYPDTMGAIIKYCRESKNHHEALARWLVANTEGDW